MSRLADEAAYFSAYDAGRESCAEELAELRKQRAFLVTVLKYLLRTHGGTLEIDKETLVRFRCAETILVTEESLENNRVKLYVKSAG